MNTLYKDSLYKTLDALAEDTFFARKTGENARVGALRWICDRQGLPGSYAGMFAPTETDRAGIRLFTGERVTSNAGIGH